MMMSPQREDDEIITANQDLVIQVQNVSENTDAGELGTTNRHQLASSSRLDLLNCCCLYGHFAAPKFSFPYDQPVRSGDAYDKSVPRSRRHAAAAAAPIERVPQDLRDIASYNRRSSSIAPVAVAIGPYHRGSSKLFKMDAAKQAAIEEFCRAASKSREEVYGKILSVAGDARSCYDDISNDSSSPELLVRVTDGEFADMMLLDGCFLLQFMFSMAAPHRPGASPESDQLMSRAEVHRRIDAIARDVLLLENQIPWLVLQALMELLPSAEHVVDSFLALMATAFDIGNVSTQSTPIDDDGHDDEPPPPHLLGLFHRRQMGAERTRSLRVPTLSSLSSTAVELGEMGVKIFPGKSNKFGDMVMTKRRRRLGLFGELSLAPVVLTEVTQCWLFNMAAYEACLGFTRADNFAVSSYIFLASILMNRREDVQEMRAKGLVVSVFSDEDTLGFFKWLAPHLQVGHRYYDVFKHLQEYRKERWLWITVHRFLYNNIKTIVAVLSAVGVLAGLFKTILSLKQPER